MAEERKRGGKGAARTELVAVRFDPRTRYGLEIASRVQRRSIANYLEWAVGESFRTLIAPGGQSVESVLESLWDPNAVTRLRRMALSYPTLLTFDEERMWKVMQVVLHVVNPAAHVDPGNVFLREEAENAFLVKQWDRILAAVEHGEDAGDLALALMPKPSSIEQQVIDKVAKRAKK